MYNATSCTGTNTSAFSNSQIQVQANILVHTQTHRNSSMHVQTYASIEIEASPEIDTMILLT